MYSCLEMKASRYLSILLLIFAAGAIQPVVAEDIWEGVFSYQKKMAEHGHPEAQIKLGEMYEEGHGTERDYEMARHWYQKAAEQGYSEGGKKLTQLQARQQREKEERKRAEQQRIAREQAAEARREHEQAEPARASEQVRREQLSQEEREAKAAEAARKKKQVQQVRKRRAEEAMKEMMATPEAYSEE